MYTSGLYVYALLCMFFCVLMCMSVRSYVGTCMSFCAYVCACIRGVCVCVWVFKWVRYVLLFLLACQRVIAVAEQTHTHTHTTYVCLALLARQQTAGGLPLKTACGIRARGGLGEEAAASDKRRVGVNHPCDASPLSPLQWTP